MANTERVGSSGTKGSDGIGIQKRKKRLRKKRTLRRLEPRVMLDAAAVATAAEITESTAEPDIHPQTSDHDGINGKANASHGLFDDPEASPNFSYENASEVIFVDSRVENPAQLTAAIESDAVTYTLDPTKDGVRQIADILANHQNISAIHLVSHGDDGLLFLGDSVLSSDSFDDYSPSLSAWGESLSDNGDIIIWGCNVAETETGQALVDRLSEVTGADIAASADATGGNAYGGDFALEYERGDIEENILDDAEAAAAYDGILAAPSDIILQKNDNLIVNGGFENPDVPHGLWTSFTQGQIPGWNTSHHVEVLNSHAGHTASEGDQWLEVDAYNDNQDNVYQDIQTVDGQSYTLSLDIARRNYTSADSNEIELYWRGTLLESITPTSTNWQTYSFTVTGSGGLDRLEFREPAAANDGFGSMIDHVRLYESGTISVPENAANGTVIGMAAGTDPDAGDTLTYTLTDNAGGRFAIDSNTGALTVADGSLLDHEADTSHAITVQVTDSEGQTYTESFTLAVTDVNEGPPVALVLDNTTVPENTANGTIIGTATGTDPDTRDTLTYSLTDNAGGRFAIDSNTGAITVADGSLLDHETDTSHAITVQVADSDGQTYTESFTLAVTDVNEAPAALVLQKNDNLVVNGGFENPDTPHRSRYTILQNTFAGWNVPNNIQISDHHYSGVGASEGNQWLQIDATTRLNTIYQDIQTTDGQSYILSLDIAQERNTSAGTNEVEVYWRGTLLESITPTSINWQTYSFTVTGSGGLDRLEFREPAATNDTRGGLIDHVRLHEIGTISVPENAANSTVIGTATGTDPDGDSLIYTLTDDAGGRFAIDSNTGAITVADASLLDHEAAASHAITVQVADGDGQIHTESFTIDVTDVNEAPATLTLDNTTVPENAANGTLIGMAAGTDPDGDTLTYSLTDDAGGRFAIDPNTGAITVADASLLNHEADTSHAITVQVADGGGEIHTESFTLAVTDVNEGPPVALVLDNTTVPENTANGTIIGTATGTDPDTRDTLTYSFTDDAGGRFAIDPNTGAITVADASLLNHEADTSHAITVQVADGDGQTYTESFTLAVTDVNEAPATLTLDNTTVSENAATGTLIGIATGTDPDGDSLTYSLTDDAGGRFAIDPNTGAITVADASLLDHETAASHAITVQVADGGGETYTESFTLTVTDINEAPTSLTLDNTTVPENAANGTLIGMAAGTDPDGDTLTYTLTDDADGRFAIDPNTGAITVADNSLSAAGTSVMHLDVSQGVVDVDGNGSVERVNDISTNGRDNPALQTNQASQPTLVSDAMNGLDALSFDGVNDHLDITDSANINLTNSTERTTSIVIKTSSDTDSRQVVYQEGGSVNGLNIYIDNGTLYMAAWSESTSWSFASINTSITSNTAYVLTMVHDGGERSLTGYVNGSSIGSVTTGSVFHAHGGDISLGNVQDHTHFHDGSFEVNDTHHFNGLIGEFAIHSNAVSSQQVALTHADLLSKWTGSPHKLDHEADTSHAITVQVADGDGQIHTESFTIDVTDVNESPATLTLDNTTVPENAANGTLIGMAAGTDPDGDTLTYSLTDDAGGRFAIAPNTGAVTVADASLLDHEAAASHAITVQVADGDGQIHTESFTLTVTDVNEAPATLTLDNTTVPENAANGTLIGMAAGTDPDGDTLTYSLTDDADGRFAIDPNTGAVTVADASLLDHEAAASHAITVQVADGDGEIHTESFTLAVTDVNESPATLTLDNTTVPENAANGTLIGMAAGTDPDGDTLTYSLTDDADGRFAIDPNTGAVTVADASLLDHEAAASHAITVQVADGDGQIHTESFTIDVTDINEAPATLTLDNTTVSENAANGTLIGMAAGTDPDAGDTLTYSLTDDADGRFAIDPDTGAVTVADASLLDHEAAASHAITVQVADGDGQIHTESFTLAVTDVNEAPATLTLDNTTVPENAANGTLIGMAAGTDPDGDTLTYSLTDDADGRFAIDSNTGAITVANASLLDHEADTSHAITVQVADGDGQIHTESFTLAVTDVNEAPATLTLDNTTVPENAANGTLIGMAAGTDPDGDTLTYSLPDDAGGRFAIDPDTGAITVADASLLDHEAANNHAITVQVADGDGQTYTESFTIDVTDVNEAPATLTLDNTTVSENAANGTLIGMAAGTDPDAGDTLTYSLTDDAGGRFAIDPDTGAITVADASLLDHEAATSHAITVQVADGDGQIHTESFTIDVTDINEAPATLTLDNTTVPENAANGTLIGMAAGTDPDGDTLTYSLPDDAGGRFAIDPNTGAITVADASLLNHEADTSHAITVQVADGDGQTYTESFTLTVTDVNEAPATLTLDNTTVSENAANGTLIGMAAGTDPDGDTLTYSLTDDAGGRFAIDSNTGAITVADANLLDHEAAASHEITVQVADGDGQTYTESFTIDVTDVNEAPTSLTLHSILHQKNFAHGTEGWSKTMTENLELFEKFPEHFGTISESEILFKEFALPGTQSEIIISFDIDETSDRNREFFIVYIDDTPVAVEERSNQQNNDNQSNSDADPTDQQNHEVNSFSFRVETTAEKVKIGFGITSDQSSDDTALGVDNLTITADTADHLIIPENAATGTLIGIATGTDPDAGDTLTYSLTDDAGGRFAIDPTTGAVTIADDSLLDHEAAASHEITVQVADSGGETYTEPFTLAVTNVSEAHTAETDYLVTGFGQTAHINVFANDAIRDGFTPSVTSVNTPNHGVAVINSDNTMSYTPNPGFSGEDRYTYVIDNGSGEQTAATVFVHVRPPPHVEQDIPSLPQVGIPDPQFRDTSGKLPEIAETVLAYEANLEGQPSGENLREALGVMAKMLYDEKEFSKRTLDFQSTQDDGPLYFKGAGDQSLIWQKFIKDDPFDTQGKNQKEAPQEEDTAQQQADRQNAAVQPPSEEESPESGQGDHQQTSPDPAGGQKDALYQGFSTQLAKLSEGFERSRRDLMDVINRL